MKTNFSTFFLVALAVLVGGAAAATEATPLQHNPFSRPPSEVTREPSPVVLADGSLQELELRATMVGLNNKLANVDGRILRPGDEVRGYTLIKIFEDRAVFAREGNNVTVYVKPDLVEGDD